MKLLKRINYYKRGNKFNPASKENIQAMFDKSKNVYNYLIKNGINKYHAFGLLGNIAMESGFNHNASNGSHWGYVQNSKEIRDYVTKHYGYDHAGQLNFLIAGLKGRLKDTKSPTGAMLKGRFDDFNRRAKGITDVEKLAEIWENAYEKSNQNLPVRKMYARELHKMYRDNNLAFMNPENAMDSTIEYTAMQPQKDIISSNLYI